MISLSSNSSTFTAGSSFDSPAITSVIGSIPGKLPFPAENMFLIFEKRDFMSLTAGSKISSKTRATASQWSKMNSASGGASRKLTGTATPPALTIP